MPEYKKQHYIPKFYFKNFSLDGKMINQFNLDRKKFYSVNIRKVCQKDYFYGKNLEIEKALSIIETEHSKIIRNTINKKLLPVEQPYYFELLRFICLQIQRTNKSKQGVNQRVELFGEEVMKPMMLSDDNLVQQGIDKEFLDSIKIRHKGMFPYQILMALESPILISDMIPILLLNQTKVKFFFSDSPVVLYNQKYWREKSGHKGF